MAHPKHTRRNAHSSSPSNAVAADAHPFELRNWQCIGLLTLFVAIFFRDILLGNAFLWEDFLYDYPARNFAAVAMAGGEIPHWNPFSFNGMPFLADIQKGVFYLPFTALTFFVHDGYLNVYWVELVVILHYVLAGVCMFYLARSFGYKQMPALFAGTVYMLSGFMITHAIHQYMITLVAWYPLVLLLFRRALTDGWRWTFMAALTLGFSTFAGFPQLSLYLYFFLFIYFLVELFALHPGKQIFSRPAITMATKAALVIALSFGLALIQLLPTMEFAELTFRAQITYQKATEGQFSWSQIITFLYPKFFGTAGAAGYTYYGPGTYWYYWETCMYVGVLPVLLIALAAIHFRKNRYVALFLGFVVFSVLYALGSNFFLHKFFFDYVPRFDTFRNPSRMGILLALGAAMLSGFALNTLLYNRAAAGNAQTLKRVLFIVSGAGVLLYLLLVTGMLRSSFPFLADPTIRTTIERDALISLVVLLLSTSLLYGIIGGKSILRWAGAGAAVLLFIDLSLFGGSQNTSSTNPREYYERARALTDFIKQDSHGDLVRVNSRNQQGMIMDRNQGMMDQIMMMEGYTPLVLQRYLPPSRDWSQACDMMNAKYRVMPDEQRGGLTLTRAATYLPRAYMVYDARVIPDSASIFRFMQSTAFEPSRTVVLEATPGLAISDTTYSADWRATFETYKLNSMAIHVSTPRAGFLVMSEIYYPGWNAYVDGTQQTIMRANWNQRAIPLTAGDHRVEVRFEPASFRRGMWATLATLAVCIGGIVLPLARRKRSQQQNAE
jgi:hypothetical protein